MLDEFHYMNDPSRGTVWEECCILSPPSVSVIALSATLTNAQQITSWLSSIHRPTALVASDFRPVPLRFHYADNLGLVTLDEPASDHLGGWSAEPGAEDARDRPSSLLHRIARCEAPAADCGVM